MERGGVLAGAVEAGPELAGISDDAVAVSGGAGAALPADKFVVYSAGSGRSAVSDLIKESKSVPQPVQNFPSRGVPQWGQYFISITGSRLRVRRSGRRLLGSGRLDLDRHRLRRQALLGRLLQIHRLSFLRRRHH